MGRGEMKEKKREENPPKQHLQRRLEARSCWDPRVPSELHPGIGTISLLITMESPGWLDASGLTTRSPNSWDQDSFSNLDAALV